MGESCSTTTLGIPANDDIGGRFIDIAIQPIAYEAEFGRTIRTNGDGTNHGWSNHYLDTNGVAVVRIPTDTLRLEIRWQSVDATTNATARLPAGQGQ